jgi:perosamine synthetase
MKKNIENPYGKYNGNEKEYVLRVLDSENKDYGKFPWVSEFEEKFCELSGAKYSISVNSATSGLHAALVAAGVQPGDEVIQPALTVVMNAFVTIQCGAIPVFADINPHTWNIDVNTIEEKITDKTKVIMAVSLFGLPLDIEPILKLAKDRGIIVIDDSAETICGLYNGQFAGTHSDLAVYSFENKKHMTSGSEGGMVITSNEDFATKVRKFAGIGYKNLTASAGRTNLASSEFQDPNYERHDVIGLNYRMNIISAAVGLAQLERIEHLVERRIIIGEMFNKAIEGCSWLKPQVRLDNANHTYYTYGVLYEGEKKNNIAWKEFYNLYKKMGGDGFYAAWVNPHLEPGLRGKKFGGILLKSGLCPVAEEYQKKIMLFKTNYRNLNLAKRNVDLLHNLINKIGN